MLSLLDCFAGAGGSSWGAVETRKISVKMAINHDAAAIATHQENLPSVNHDIADVFQVNPKRYPKTDLAWFSPCCEAEEFCVNQHLDEAGNWLIGNWECVIDAITDGALFSKDYNDSENYDSHKEIERIQQLIAKAELDWDCCINEGQLSLF